MKMYIDKDEAYPVYQLSKPLEKWTGGVEVTEEFYKRYLEVLAEYQTVQQELADMYDEYEEKP